MRPFERNWAFACTSIVLFLLIGMYLIAASISPFFTIVLVVFEVIFAGSSIYFAIKSGTVKEKITDKFDNLNPH